MFSTQNNLKNQTPGKLESLFGIDTDLRGSIHCRGSIRIDGHVEGNIHAETVMVGETATVQGDILAKVVIVGGKVNGNIVADMLDIKPKSQIVGDLKTKHLSIAEGARFEGNCSMTKDIPQVIDLDSLGVAETASPKNGGINPVQI